MHLRKIIFLILSLGLLLATGAGQAQTPRPSEYQLKAAFLFNFAKFVDWPTNALPDDQSPFIIGILGDNPFGNDLEQTVVGKRINDHPMVVRVFRNATETIRCHILFISASAKKQFPEIIQSLHGVAVLTVGETDGFIEAGGMVNFTEMASKIRFQINQDAAKSSGLKISSKLMNLAVSSPR